VCVYVCVCVCVCNFVCVYDVVCYLGCDNFPQQGFTGLVGFSSHGRTVAFVLPGSEDAHDFKFLPELLLLVYSRSLAVLVILLVRGL